MVTAPSLLWHHGVKKVQLPEPDRAASLSIAADPAFAAAGCHSGDLLNRVGKKVALAAAKSSPQWLRGPRSTAAPDYYISSALCALELKAAGSDERGPTRELTPWEVQRASRDG